MLLWSLLTGCGEQHAEPPPPPAPVAAPAADPHAGHEGHGAHSSGDHMAKMAELREALRAQLGAPYDAPVPGLDQADPAAGKVVYDTSCASCHGPAGKGDGPAGAGLNPLPSDLTDAFHARYYSDAGRVHIIRNGSPGTGMVGFAGTLSDQQVLDVYAYVRSLRG